MNIHWSETLGNRFLLKPDERFFTHSFLKGETVITIERNVSINGQSKLKLSREDLIQVEYDRAYLIEYLKCHLRPFFKLSWIQLAGLIKEAFSDVQSD